MVNYPISVPVAIGNLVSEAVEGFAKEHRLPDYDLWYHDEPLWLIREVTKKQTGEVLVKRLQVSVFDTAGGHTIKVIPDAYITPSEGRWEEKKVINTELRFKLSREQSVRDILQAFSKDREHGKSELRKMLEEAWRSACELASKLDTL